MLKRFWRGVGLGFGGGHFLITSNSEEGKIGSGIERRNNLRSEAARNGASGYEERLRAWPENGEDNVRISPL